jgi:hypothetical protein
MSRHDEGKEFWAQLIGDRRVRRLGLCAITLVAIASAPPARGETTVNYDNPGALSGLTETSPVMYVALEAYPSKDFLLVPIRTDLQGEFETFWGANRARVCDQLRATLQAKDHFGPGQAAHDVVCRLAPIPTAAYLDERGLGSPTLSIKPALADAYVEPIFANGQVRVAFLVSGNALAFNVTTKSPLSKSDDPLISLEGFSLLVELTLQATPASEQQLDNRGPISVVALSARIVHATLTSKSLLVSQQKLVDAAQALGRDDHAKELEPFKPKIEGSFTAALKPITAQGFSLVRYVGFHAPNDLHLAMIGGTSSTVPLSGPGQIAGAFWWRLADLRQLPSPNSPKRPHASPPTQSSAAQHCDGVSATAAVQVGEGAIWTNLPPTKPAGQYHIVSYAETGGLAICNYAITNLPEGANIRVKAAVSPSRFSTQLTLSEATRDFYVIPAPGLASAPSPSSGQGYVAASTQAVAGRSRVVGYVERFPRQTRSKVGEVYDVDFQLTPASSFIPPN